MNRSCCRPHAASRLLFPRFGGDVIHVYLARVVHYPGVAALVDCDTHCGEIGVSEVVSELTRAAP